MCNVVSYNSSTGELIFTVDHFSSFASGLFSNLTIWDDTDFISKPPGAMVKFYANFTNQSNDPINGTNIYCEFKENTAGSWSTPINMSFNATSKLYEYNKTISNGGYFLFNVVCNGLAQSYDILNATDSFLVSKGIIPMNSGTPFYTTTNNPMNSSHTSCLGNLKAGQTCNQTWQVNATGQTDVDWEFYVIYNSTHASNQTPRVNITIVIDQPPNTTLVSPAPGYTSTTADVTFSCNATDDFGLTNISLYITNSTNQAFSLNQTNTSISGKSNSTNWTLTLTDGDYTWNCLAYDTGDNSDWDSNRSLIVAVVNLPPITDAGPDQVVNISAAERKRRGRMYE